MICTKCEKEGGDGKFCKNCGALLLSKISNWERIGDKLLHKEDLLKLRFLSGVAFAACTVFTFLLLSSGISLVNALIQDKNFSIYLTFFISALVSLSLIATFIGALVFGRIFLASFKMPKDGKIVIDISNIDHLESITTYNSRVLQLKLKEPVYGLRTWILEIIYFGSDFEEALKEARSLLGENVEIRKRFFNPLMLFVFLKNG